MKKQTIGLVLLACSFVVSAGQFSLSPLGFYLEKPAPQEIRLTNPGNTPISFQTYASSWSQVDGKNVYEKTNEVTTSPSVVTVQPHSTAIVRVIALSVPQDGNEHTYKIHVNELPSNNSEMVSHGGMMVKALSANILPYVIRPSSLKPVLVSSCVNGKFTATNNGNATAHVTRRPGEGGHLDYVLPGSTVSFNLPCGSQKLRVNGVETTL